MLNKAVMGVVIGMLISTLCALTCCRLDKLVPINYILLAVFTMAESWLVGVTVMAV